MKRYLTQIQYDETYEEQGTAVDFQSERMGAIVQPGPTKYFYSVSYCKVGVGESMSEWPLKGTIDVEC